MEWEEKPKQKKKGQGSAKEVDGARMGHRSFFFFFLFSFSSLFTHFVPLFFCGFCLFSFRKSCLCVCAVCVWIGEGVASVNTRRGKSLLIAIKKRIKTIDP